MIPVFVYNQKELVLRINKKTAPCPNFRALICVSKYKPVIFDLSSVSGGHDQIALTLSPSKVTKTLLGHYLIRISSPSTQILKISTIGFSTIDGRLNGAISGAAINQEQPIPSVLLSAPPQCHTHHHLQMGQQTQHLRRSIHQESLS